MKKEKAKKKQSKLKINGGIPVINPHCAGIDIGDTEHHVAFIDPEEGQVVLTFGSFTEDLEAIVKLLMDKGITTVAMEATGIYFVPLYLMLEKAKIEPYLVNAKHVKNVTGRKSDDSDAIWIQKLHACGLLQKCFQPNEEDRVLREYVRSRKNLIRLNADAMRRMQKALELMNIKIHTVISDIVGKTGLAIIAAIVGGERDCEILSQLRDPRIVATQEEVAKSLKGLWEDQYLFQLGMAYEEYLFRHSQIKKCEEKIREQLMVRAAKINEGDISEVMQTEKVKKKLISPQKISSIYPSGHC